MTERMIEVARKALEFQRMCLENDPRPFAHAILQDKDGDITMLAIANDYFESGKTKDELAELLLTEMLRRRSVLAFANDSWMAKYPEGDRNSMPASLRDWPAELRQDVLIVYVNELGQKGELVRQLYHRDEKGKAIFEEPEWDLPASNSRFIFDMREEILIKRAKALLELFGKPLSKTN